MQHLVYFIEPFFANYGFNPKFLTDVTPSAKKFPSTAEVKKFAEDLRFLHQSLISEMAYAGLVLIHPPKSRWFVPHSRGGVGSHPTARIGRWRKVVSGGWVSIHAAAFQSDPVNPTGGLE
ncbi:hypothetical protein Q9L58_009097 [Maublancomyces gigas]|uniref:Uncharacterized protein n=1 Tax=Discina gigas TaxID=1032678 RepID=A0ABR3G7T2_9PEZI